MPHPITAKPIPGNVYPRLPRIDADTTREFLEQRLRRVVSNQKANKRLNPVYVAEVARLRRAIDARS